MNITHENNFCRVFILPQYYPEGFLHSGSKPVIFDMVDWFNPIPSRDIESGDLKTWDEYEGMLVDFWKRKQFYNQNREYLLITDFGKSIIFTGPK